MMFLYESLSDYKKESIDEEIESRIKSMVLNNRGFNYTERQFHALIYDLIIYGEQINAYLGDDTFPFFNLKEIVVKSRAIKMAYELEQGRPSRDLIEFYVELCKDLSVEPTTEVLFDRNLAVQLAHFLSGKRSIVNEGVSVKDRKTVDNESEDSYYINSNIILFESLVRDFYNNTDSNIE